MATFLTHLTGMVRFKILRQVVVFSFWTSMFTGFGNIASAQINNTVHQLDSVVITAQYAPGIPEKSVHKVNIIGKEKIQTMGAQNLRDVFSNELNLRLSQDNILGSSMSMQGISGQNVKILMDGVPVTGRMNGNIDLSQINLNNVERIEIVEGPLSVNYGTDALAGTINIITNKTQKQTFSTDLNAYYESTGQYNTTARLGYRKKNTIISLSGGRNFFDGWQTTEQPFYIEKPQLADSSRYDDWKPKEQYFGTFYAGQYFRQLKLGFTSDYFSENVINRGLPRAPYGENAFDDYYKTRRFGNSLNLTGQLGQHFFTNILVAHTHFKRIKSTFFKDLTSLSETLSLNSGDQDTTIFNNIVSRASLSSANPASKLNFEAGYDIKLETGTGLRVKNGKKIIGDYAVFGSVEYKLYPDIVIRPGLRILYNTAYKAPLVPSVNFKFQPFQSFAMRLSYARGFRAPALKELYFFFVDINHNITGNEALKAEYSHNLSYNMSLLKQINTLNVKADLSLFYNYIDNLITLAQKNEIEYTYFNLTKFQTLGIQLQSEFKWKNLTLNAGGAYIGRYNQLSENYNTGKFAFSPEARCNMIYNWEKTGMVFSLYYKYTGILPSFGLSSDDEIVKTNIRDYQMADISVSKRIWKQHINLTVGSKNLFDVKNISGIAEGNAHSSANNSIPLAMGRTYFVKLDFNLHTKE
ncbi:MAG: TonB-dependent receptor [Sphingobacteriales bacterium]|nr:MAG: TonB-dependent receptor [Sphingobacteriales bacterium]